MIFLVDLEAVETRYTGEWKHHLPALLRKHGHDVHVIAGPTDIPSATTPGAFLNFGGTNIYKAHQIEQMGRLFTEGRVNSGDHFLFTDAWHPGIINLKYMAELLGIPVKIHALWHAGSYDPQDFLGRLIGDAAWVRHSEKAFFEAVDHNYFATDFHINMFIENLLGKHPRDARLGLMNPGHVVRSGWPMEYMPDTLSMYSEMEKRNLILFPHRIAPEKQVDIFRDLKEQLPQYEFVVCQDTRLTKNEYHNLLGEAKLVFSANLQETLGISMYEGSIVNAIPMVPDRLSYSEMFADIWKYPSAWTESWDNYITHRKELCDKIIDYMENYREYARYIPQQAHSLNEHFFSCNNILKKLK